MWEAVETEAGEVRLVKAKGRRRKEGTGKKMRRKRTEKRKEEKEQRKEKKKKKKPRKKRMIEINRLVKEWKI